MRKISYSILVRPMVLLLPDRLMDLLLPDRLMDLLLLIGYR
jgi:hypothetical protein